MRVEGSKQAVWRQSEKSPPNESPAPQDHSRALVVQTPAAESPTAMAHRQAAFLAHLIAVKDQHPQTRERRRAYPDEVIAAYRAVAAMPQRY